MGLLVGELRPRVRIEQPPPDTSAIGAPYPYPHLHRR